MIETMFDRLQGAQNRDFAAIGFACAAFRLKVLEYWSDLEWLQERFCYMNDIIRESPFYQWILEEGEVKGVAQGIAQGVAQSVAQMRQAVVDFVRDDFPELVQLAEEVVATIDNPTQLVHLTAKLVVPRMQSKHVRSSRSLHSEEPILLTALLLHLRKLKPQGCNPSANTMGTGADCKACCTTSGIAAITLR